MSFFFSILYLIIEYMRPQQMYEAISDFPLAQIAIIAIIVCFALEGKRLNNFNFQNVLMLIFLFWHLVCSLLALNLN